MKRLFYLVLSVFVLMACGGNDSDELNDPENPEVPSNVTLEISTPDLLFEGDGGTLEFTVTSSGSWKVSSSAEWCKTNFPAGSGNLTVAVTTEAYIGMLNERVAVVTVQAGSKKRELKVTQKPVKEIHLEQDTIYVVAEGETISVEVKNYVDGVEYQVSTSDWISPAPKGKSIVSKTFDFVVAENVAFRRTGYIAFSVSSLTDTVWVEQEAEPEPEDFTETVSFDMVYVQGGTFQMGATSEQGWDFWGGEKPVHEVTLSDYYIGKYEVTQGLWKAVMGENPSYFDEAGDDYPVENVSWNDVQEFIAKLNELTGRKYVLPTEAQWEYAARGGVKTQGYKYSGSNDIEEVAWCAGDWNTGSTHPVGTKKANELGIYDMSGNVWEWCQDWYDDYGSEAQTSPAGPETGSNRVLRGGGWNNDARFCRVSSRGSYDPSCRRNAGGFRLVLLP